MRTSISDGLGFMERHFTGDNSLYPKLVATKGQWCIPVNNKEEAISVFYGAKLMDCRICPYPSFADGYRKPDAREAMTHGGIGIAPNFLFIDLDKGRFSRTLDAYAEDALTSALYQILDRINERLHGEFNPTVIQTGNGFHIYLPVQLSGPSWCLGHTDIFMNVSKTPDRDFLRWAEYYLSDGLADPAHYTTTSFNNMWCRVPGSFNSKNGAPVKVLQEWDGQRPYINWLLRDFHNYLVDKSLKPKKEPSQGYWRFSTKWD